MTRYEAITKRADEMILTLQNEGSDDFDYYDVALLRNYAGNLTLREAKMGATVYDSN